ncbi:hypothetical protein [Olivibacter sitiensis]|uniref:hypothetical protein n=1 Tax=Olivibacter sitiensis TaxID=376470 RepID=UPI0004157548|nr:hypothetical protein [Olivibacter sitiensis]
MGNFIAKVFISFVLIISGIGNVFAQRDSSAYDIQRQKINQLLQERSSRFGDFDKSLKAKTGIFGLKTKKDMQASIDILKQIVQNDELIFKETRALLDFKDIERKNIEEQVSLSGNRINGYINTISKLQKANDDRQTEINALRSENSIYLLLCVGLGTLSLLLLVLLMRYRITSSKNKDIH